MTECENIVYSLQLRDELRGRVESKIAHYKSILKDILILDELYRFGYVGGVFDRSFLDEISTICALPSDYPVINKWIMEVDKLLVRIPFEQAYCYKNPDFWAKSNTELLHCVFGDNIEWRSNPSSIRVMSEIDRKKVLSYFEYMCYYVINRREELLFDIQSSCM
jgi:hypothetical protein